MRELLIQTKDKHYPVIILPSLFSSSDWLNRLTFPSGKGAIVTNTTVGELYAQKVQRVFRDHSFDAATVTIPDGEQYKEIGTVEDIYHQLLKEELDRKSFLLALGGGVITDVCGFVASTYLRGIQYFQIPTSLLAQVDSSVGGKTGVNLAEGKNLVGTFYQPEGVVIGLDFLETLPDREYREGLSEIIKAALLTGGEFFEYFDSHAELILARDRESLEEVIFQSVRFKGDIVEEDEKEKGVRSILNYGHTLGHALEKTLGYGVLRHGEAVAVGMMGAVMIAEKMGFTTMEVVNIHKQLLIRCGLPVSLPYAVSPGGILHAMMKDKKTMGGSLRFVLIKAIGEPVYSIPVEVGLILEVLPRLVEVVT